MGFLFPEYPAGAGKAVGNHLLGGRKEKLKSDLFELSRHVGSCRSPCLLRQKPGQWASWPEAGSRGGPLSLSGSQEMAVAAAGRRVWPCFPPRLLFAQLFWLLPGLSPW